VSDHVYAIVVGMPAIKNCTRVYKDQLYDVDLINGDAINVWEPPKRTFQGTINKYNWTELEDYFDVEPVPPALLEEYERAHDLVHSLAPCCGRPSPFESDRNLEFYDY
jgi:hypothetical protein